MGKTISTTKRKETFYATSKKKNFKKIEKEALKTA